MSSARAYADGAARPRQGSASGAIAYTVQESLVPISHRARIILVLYFVFWRILPAIALSFDAPSWESFGRAVVYTACQCILLIPVYLRSMAGMPTGWLHPLVLPTLASIARDVVRNPLSILTPVTFWFAEAQQVQHAVLGILDLRSSIALQFKEDFLILVALVAYYLGFMAVSRPVRRRSAVHSVSVSRSRIVAFIGASLVAFFVLVKENGGIADHFASLAGGRALMSEDVGHLLVLVRFLPYLLVFWYIHQPRLLATPWFTALLFFSLTVVFLATGSRSSLVEPIAVILAARILINRELPLVSAGIIATAAFLLLGILGEIRMHSNQLNVMSIVEVEGISDLAELSHQDIKGRQSLDGSAAVYYLVPDEAPYLLGSSYLGALMFWIPRSIWSDKPRGAGAHVGAILYGGRDGTSGYYGAGYPIGAIAEAYWNFGVFGVVVFYFLFGLFHNRLLRVFLKDPRNPFWTMIFLVATLEFTGPGSDQMIPFVQLSILLYIVWRFAVVRRREVQR